MEHKVPRPSRRMISRGRNLRRQSFMPERLLWSRLRNGRCGGFRFRRQHPVGPYVVDFFCATARLVTELDGRSHDERVAYDQARQREIESQGFEVIRIANDAVIQGLDAVAEGIAVACRERAERGPDAAADCAAPRT